MTENKGRVMNIVRIILAAVLALVFAMLLILGILIKEDPEKVSELPFSIFLVKSDSMYPTFSTDCGIIVADADFSTLKLGDIVTIYQGGELVTHRIVAINDNYITTKGDGNTYTDAPVNVSSYVGKVVVILPGFAGFLSLCEGWKKAIWIAVIIFVLFAPEAIFRISEAMREKRRMAN